MLVQSSPSPTHLSSLSISSPKPGVSTMVRNMQVRSSSSSISARQALKSPRMSASKRHTNSNRLNLKPLLRECAIFSIRVSVRQDGAPTEHIHESGPTCKKQLVRHQDSFQLWGAASDEPVPDAPQTIRENGIPFFAAFFRRIICCREVDQLTYGHTCDG